MKYITITLLAAAMCLWSAVPQARSIREMTQEIKQPMELKAGTSERMHVMFPHTAHRGVSCMQCHHEMGETGRYVACTECHATPGAKERDPMSMYMAFHAKGTDRSCYGCHARMVEAYPAKYGQKFAGCRPCHMSPGLRKAAQAQR